MSTYKITHCTTADAAALSANNIPAFWQDPNWVLTWRHNTLEFQIEQVTKRFPRNLLDDRETKRHQKAVDPETGRVVGYARWFIPLSHAVSGEGEVAWAEAVVPGVGVEEEVEVRRVAEMAVWEPRDRSDGEPVREIKEEILARKPFMRLDYLAVHPDNQGKGIATALVESGMSEAKKLGLDIFILAYRAGLGVYRRLGFRVERELVQDDSGYGGSGDYRTYFMIFEQDTKTIAE